MSVEITHVFNMELLKDEFMEIMNVTNDIVDTRIIISDKLSRLKKLYNDLIKTNNKKIFLFCLDSFYFQYRILSTEMEHINRFISLINNRMYGDYYKLYNIVLVQLREKNIGGHYSELSNKKFPVYKDVDPYVEYSTENIIDIHYEILKIINDLHNTYLGKENKIQDYIQSSQVGISITNFINTLEYENSMLREQIGLYNNYVLYFHQLQKTYLMKLNTRMTIFQKEIEQDILCNKKHIETRTQPPTHDTFLNEYFLNAKLSKSDYLLDNLSENADIAYNDVKVTFSMSDNIDNTQNNTEDV